MRAVRTFGAAAAAAVLLMNANIIAPRESVESAARNELRTGQQASARESTLDDVLCMRGWYIYVWMALVWSRVPAAERASLASEGSKTPGGPPMYAHPSDR